MEEMLHQLTDGKHPMISRVSAILLVVQDLWRFKYRNWGFAAIKNWEVSLAKTENGGVCKYEK